MSRSRNRTSVAEPHAVSEHPRPQHAPPEAYDATEAAKAAQRKPGRIKVRAIADGYAGLKRRRRGDVFTISGERHPEDLKYGGYEAGIVKDLRGKPHPKAGQLKELGAWMEILPEGDPSPERTTTSTEAQNRLRQEMRGALIGPEQARSADAGADDDDAIG